MASPVREKASFDAELHAAVGANDVTRIQKLLASGVNVIAFDSIASTPLHWAAEMNASAAAKVLIEAGADIDAVGIDGERPLHCAAEKNASAAAKVLIKAGADINAAVGAVVRTADGPFFPLVIKNGRRPLHCAAEKNASTAANVLIKADADFNAAIGAAVLTADRPFFHLVVTNGWRPLHCAAAKNASAVAEVLIEAGADVNVPDGDGQRPLHWAVEKNALDVAKVLIEAGADVNAVSRFGERPLHWAVVKNASAVAKVLIEAGADVNAADGYGQRPLHRIPIYAASDVHEVLIEAGADVDATNESKETPLHVAARRGNTNTVQFLLRAGADPQLCNLDGKTPLQLAREGGHNGVAEILKKKTKHSLAWLSAQLDPGNQEENALRGAPSYSPLLSSQQSTEEKPLTIALPPEKWPTAQPQIMPQSPGQSKESTKIKVEAPPQHSLIGEEHRNSTTDNSDSDSSWTSEEATDEVRAIHDLKEGDIFAENYYVETKPILGKPLVRIAKGMSIDRNVILKFYTNPELFAKALSSYERLNRSRYVCKPIEKIKAHQGFPDCLAFEKGIRTLDEWVRIPDVGLTSKKEALQLVAEALCDIHSHGVVHCDVKPANLVFFDMEHKWKLLDIDSAQEEGVTGGIMTTISYASPEVLEAVEAGQVELALQTSADMWAYGIIAFEVLMGERFYKFEPTVESVLEFLHSKGFEERLNSVEDRKQRHFIKKFLKRQATERQSARAACTSSIFESATITIEPNVSRANKRT